MNQKRVFRPGDPDSQVGAVGAEDAPNVAAEAAVKLARAKCALLPEFNTAAVVQAYPGPALGKQDFNALLDVTSELSRNMLAGDMGDAEAMLFGQAQALQAVFVNLLRRAAAQDSIRYSEPYMRMALKAQNQCRMTLETLATIKNPPTIFAKQANINNGGQQQVNNGVATGSAVRTGTRARARAKKPGNRPNELLETDDGNGLDLGATSKAGGGDQAVAPLGEIDRSDKRRG